MSRGSAKRPAQRKIAFLVDGDKEKLLVEALARKVVARHRPAAEPCFATIRCAGTPRAGLFSVVELMLTKHYQEFFILFGTGSTHRQRISSMAEEIQEPLVRLRLMDMVKVLPLVPSIERWVLADKEAIELVAGTRLPEKLPRRREQLEELLREQLGDWGSREQKRVARYLDPERIRAKDASFDAFVRALLAALETRAHASAEQGAVAP